MPLAETLHALHEEIAAACRQAGRNPAEITLVAVTKTRSPQLVREAWEAGVRHVGENRVQELLAKKPLLADLDLTWHLIGSLQTNKVKAVLPHVALLHALDRLELAQAIAKHSPAGPLPALIQVNTTSEASKSGCAPGGVDPLIDAVRAIPQVLLRGFMTIGPWGGSEAENRRAFALLRTVRDRNATRHRDLDLSILSMGMSDDYREAILEGATHLRIGSRIFGARPMPPPPLDSGR